MFKEKIIIEMKEVFKEVKDAAKKVSFFILTKPVFAIRV